MFRIRSSFITSKCLLYRNSRLNLQQLPITSNPPSLKYKKPGVQIQEREPCPIPPPPPTQPPKEDTLFWATMSLLVVGGTFIIYARSNPEIRDWLTIRAPWVDDFIAIMYQENMTHREYAALLFEKAKKALKKLKIKMLGKPQIEGTTPVKISKTADSSSEEVPDCQDKEGDYVIVSFSDLDSKPDGKVVQKKEDKTDPCKSIIPPPILTKNICEIEKCMQELGDSTICYYTKARAACVYYNKLVKSLMADFNVPAMMKVDAARKERIAAVNENVEKAKNLTAKLDELNRYFECGVTASKEALKNTKALLKEYKFKIKSARILWEQENDEAVARDNQWKKVQDVMNKYIEENQAMTKGLKYDTKKLQFLGDGDLLLYHTMRYVSMLNDQLADVLSTMKDRINRGVDSLSKIEKHVIARNKDMEMKLFKKTAALDAEFTQRIKEKKAENDQNLKESLKKLLDQTQDTLKQKLNQKEIDAEEKLNKLVSDQVALERRVMNKEISNMADKLGILERKLEARLQAEKEARRSQELWSAGAALLAATKKGDPIVKVDKELKAIEKAAGRSDKLISTVLKAIPESVRKKGVVPESVLREKYRVMEDIALKVALVEQDGAILPTYVLSYIQSIFLFMKINGIPQSEFEKPPKEPAEDLDTFDLLQRARFWMDRGDIAAALKYVTALEGASRAAAAAWGEAARSHLETKQAAEAVLAHATALGLQYV